MPENLSIRRFESGDDGWVVSDDIVVGYVDRMNGRSITKTASTWVKTSDGLLCTYMVIGGKEVEPDRPMRPTFSKNASDHNIGDLMYNTDTRRARAAKKRHLRALKAHLGMPTDEKPRKTRRFVVIDSCGWGITLVRGEYPVKKNGAPVLPREGSPRRFRYVDVDGRPGLEKEIVEDWTAWKEKNAEARRLQQALADRGVWNI